MRECGGVSAGDTGANFADEDVVAGSASGGCSAEQLSVEVSEVMLLQGGVEVFTGAVEKDPFFFEES